MSSFLKKGIDYVLGKNNTSEIIKVPKNSPIYDYCSSAQQWYQNDKLHRDDGPAIEYTNGMKEWYQNGQLHRDDGPAIEFPNGSKEWYQFGLSHREDGPAVEFANGYKAWYMKGMRHRIGGPAIEHQYDTKEWYQNDKRHRVDGPAIERKVGDKTNKTWYQNGQLHRLDGPALVSFDEFIKDWFLNDIELSPKEIKDHQIDRIKSLTIALSPLNLPPYVIFWILEWSESSYISELPQYAVIRMIEGIRNSRDKIKTKIEK